MSIKNLPKLFRPREKLVEKGAPSLKDQELLAILLRTGTKKKNALQCAESILKKYSLRDLVDVRYDDLTALNGIDIGKACTILAAYELVTRALDRQIDLHPLIQKPRDAVSHLASIRHLKKEHFVVLFLNARNQLIHKETITIGTLNSSLVHPREVYEPAVRLHTAAIIVAHNHPSGDASPSKADITVTAQLVESGKILGIELLDHLILTQKDFTSMKEEGYIQ